MNVAIAQRPDDGDDSHGQPVQHVQIPVPSREQITAQQLGILVQSAMQLSNVLPPTATPDGEPLQPKNSEMDIAVETTIIGICSQIDKIVAENSRWGMQKHRSLEQQISRVYAAHIQSLKEQSIALRATQRVPVELLYIREADEWVCIMAEGRSRDQLLGRGKYPAEALADFDRKFLGTTQNTNEQENQQSRVVDTGNQHTSAHAKKRQHRRKHRKSDGTKPEGGLPKN